MIFSFVYQFSIAIEVLELTSKAANIQPRFQDWSAAPTHGGLSLHISIQGAAFATFSQPLILTSQGHKLPKHTEKAGIHLSGCPPPCILNTPVLWSQYWGNGMTTWSRSFYERQEHQPNGYITGANP